MGMPRERPRRSLTVLAAARGVAAACSGFRCHHRTPPRDGAAASRAAGRTRRRMRTWPIGPRARTRTPRCTSHGCRHLPTVPRRTRRRCGRRRMCGSHRHAAGPDAAPPFDECSFDLVWSEGAVYVMGFATGLRAWRPLVRPAGLVVVTEATWFTDAPSARARSFWADAYPAMTDVTTNERIAAQAGYQVIGTHRLADHANSTATTVTSTATPGSYCDASTDRSTVGLGPIRRGSSARAWSGRRR